MPKSSRPTASSKSKKSHLALEETVASDRHHLDGHTFVSCSRILRFGHCIQIRVLPHMPEIRQTPPGAQRPQATKKRAKRIPSMNAEGIFLKLSCMRLRIGYSGSGLSVDKVVQRCRDTRAAPQVELLQARTRNPSGRSLDVISTFFDYRLYI